MKLFRMITVVMFLCSLAGMQVMADEAAVFEQLEGKVQRLDIKHGTIRISGESYRLAPDMEVMDSREGGTVNIRSVVAGSKVGVKVRHDEDKLPEIIYLEVHDMPLK